MNKQDLVKVMAAQSGISKAAAGAAFDSLTDAIMAAAGRGERVTLVGFGTFYTSKRAARTGRNPRSGAPIKIPAATVPRFTAGAEFKETVNKKK